MRLRRRVVTGKAAQSDRKPLQSCRNCRTICVVKDESGLCDLCRGVKVTPAARKVAFDNESIAVRTLFGGRENARRKVKRQFR